MKRTNIAARKAAGKILAYVTLTLCLIMTLFPLFWITVTSFKNKIDFTAYPPKFLNFNFTFNAYRQVFVEDKFINNILNSIIVVFGSLFLSTVLAIPAAYATARRKGSFFEQASFFIISLRLLPQVAVILPMYFIFRTMGLLDTHLSLILMYTLMNLPLAMWLNKIFIAEIPYQIEEAAMLDGYSFWQILFKTILPMAKPGIIATMILNFMTTWNEFMYANLLGSLGAKTAPIAAVAYVGVREVRWAETCAASVVIIVPTIIVLLLVQKHLVRGLTFGSVKG
ncbi:MAG TPA: carbohydrate ABC transporter permease [Clostridia bacterium]